MFSTDEEEVEFISFIYPSEAKGMVRKLELLKETLEKKGK